MPTIIEFLHDRLSEDERIAESNAVYLWPGHTLKKVASGDQHHFAWQPHDISPQRIAQILRWSPARVLAEVEAKRGMVDYCAELLAKFERSDVWGGWPDVTSKSIGEDLLFMLAVPYADHPDYDPTWAPEQARKARP